LYSVALAETSDEHRACMNDAFRVCWRAIPNRHAVYLCLLENHNQLSPACRAAITREQQPRRFRRESGNNDAGTAERS